ncbi:eCIS core domain-containing protein [Streptomyces sp. NPDC004752]
MGCYEQGREGEHEHDESVKATRKGNLETVSEASIGSSSDASAQPPAELPHLLAAAATGRTDVLGSAGVTALQRTVGNTAVRSALRRRAEEPEAETVQRGEQRSSVHEVITSGGGQPLDTDTRTDMEARLGADFSSVRVHTGSVAHESAKEVGAHAYTVGDNVVFQRDSYDPASHRGRVTLAHELTHVIQQRSGPVDGTEAPGGIRVSDPSDRFELEASANAERVMSAPARSPDSPAPAVDSSGPVSAQTSSAPPPATATPVQRQTEDEDEEPADVQGSFVQRATDSAVEEEEESAPEE